MGIKVEDLQILREILGAAPSDDEIIEEWSALPGELERKIIKAFGEKDDP